MLCENCYNKVSSVLDVDEMIIFSVSIINSAVMQSFIYF